MWKQYMTGSKRWHLKLALEHLWDRKKWKFQNSFSAVNVLKHSTHLQTWKGTWAARKKKKGNNRTTVMRKVKKLLSDPDVLKEIQRQRKHGSSSGVIDETLVTTIMAQIPNISNFKENRQFDAFNMECMAWSAHNFQMSNCNLFESWSQRLCVPSEPLGLKIVRALEQASLQVRKAPLTWASELEMSLCVPS